MKKYSKWIILLVALAFISWASYYFISTTDWLFNIKSVSEIEVNQVKTETLSFETLSEAPLMITAYFEDENGQLEVEIVNDKEEVIDRFVLKDKESATRDYKLATGIYHMRRHISAQNGTYHISLYAPSSDFYFGVETTKN